MRLQIVILISAGMLLWGTNIVAQASAPPKSTSKAPVKDMEKRLDSLEWQVKSLQGRVPFRTVTLNCNTVKYEEFLISPGSLVFFAACTKVEPFLEGHRINVSIGNPHLFNFSNVKGILHYGKEWALENKVEITTTEPIRAGTWNTITITINPSTPEELRYLTLELESATAGATR